MVERHFIKVETTVRFRYWQMFSELYTFLGLEKPSGGDDRMSLLILLFSCGKTHHFNCGMKAGLINFCFSNIFSIFVTVPSWG